jgi:hypothetical protein
MVPEPPDAFTAQVVYNMSQYDPARAISSVDPGCPVRNVAPPAAFALTIAVDEETAEGGSPPDSVNVLVQLPDRMTMLSPCIEPSMFVTSVRRT